MARLENDFTNRMCGTTDDESYMDNLMTTGFGEVSEQDEYVMVLKLKLILIEIYLDLRGHY